jgi:protein-L-isoaspartate(D-aspartate) O-methyltransferase
MSESDGDRAELRRLLAEIARETEETEAWTGRRKIADRVMTALAEVPRIAFVPVLEQPLALVNRPLGIGYGQTISQPFIVAIMTELLDLGGDERVLEIGTGSGYQSAVLSLLAGRVFSVEIVPQLAGEARRRLKALGYANVEVREGDGWQGWPEHAPYDAIIVTAAPTEVPQALIEQLGIGGRLVIPIGPPMEAQMLYRCVKRADGTLEMQRKLPVAFVPMIPGE